MTQHYSNPERESDPHALPDVEVFYHRAVNIELSNFTGRCEECGETRKLAEVAERNLCHDCAREANPDGWYWWTCLPGCLPDGEPNGPFETEAEAVADAQAGSCYFDDEVRVQQPQCVLSMRCYCAGHARGNPASEPCATTEVGS